MKREWNKILVTGADGFIGSHLTEYLLSLGYRVRAVSFYNSFNFWGHLEEFYYLWENQLEVVCGDIRDELFCRKIMDEIDVVFHLAALIAIPFSYIAPQSYVDTNIKGTLNLLNAARDAGIKRFVHTSTSEVYGTARYVPIDENHPLNPQSPYAATKLSADKLALSFYMSFDLPVVVVRPFNTYGPRQSARAVIPTIILQALEFESIRLGDTSTERDFNFVEDTVRGIVEAGFCDKLLGEEVNIGSGVSYKISDVVRIVGDILGKNVKIELDEKRLRPPKSEVRVLLCSAEKIKRFTNWRPQVSFEEGLKKTVNWFSENKKKYKVDIYNV